MNNFFLFKDALNTRTLAEFENGINSLLDVVAKKNRQHDTLFRFEDFWNQSCVHGLMYEIPSKLSKEYKGLSVKLFNSFTPFSIDILNEVDFDFLFSNDCNGFKGFDFTTTTLPTNRRVIDLSSFNNFKINCANQKVFNSVQSFWESKEFLFPNLIFCERVLAQIEHLSVNDDRFLLIIEKLKRLNTFTGTWNQGVFDYKNLGLDNSPDTPVRVRATEALRTFHCPDIGNRVFSLHIKWYFGNEPFRLYYYPESTNHKVYIGYIGDKGQIGF